MATYMTTKDLVANTESEILADALDVEPHELTNWREDDGQDDDFEAVEGWDGNPLSDDEQWETTQYGHDNNSGFDRPLQLARDQDLEEAVAQRDQFIAAQQQRIANLQMLADPGLQQRAASLREDLAHRVIANTDQHIDYTLGLEQQRNQLQQELQARDVNYSLNMAQQQYGEHFDRAYATLTRMNPADPRAQAQVRAIWDAPDPGDALMRWYSGAAARPLSSGGASRGRMPPSLNGGERAYRSDRASGRPQRGSSNEWPVGEEMEVGPYNSSEDAEVMASVWR